MVQGDWDGLLAFADKFLLSKPVERSFDQFPAEWARVRSSEFRVSNESELAARYLHGSPPHSAPVMPLPSVMV
jgi:hypothetical protein